MLNIMPFLLFEGNCAEAMAFYQACLGGELTLTKVADTPMKDTLPRKYHKTIIYSCLKSGTLQFSAADWSNPDYQAKPGNTYGLYVNDGTYGELKAIFDKLAAGADPKHLLEIKEVPFGIYGHLVDKFGVYWIFRGEK